MIPEYQPEPLETLYRLVNEMSVLKNKGDLNAKNQSDVKRPYSEEGRLFSSIRRFFNKMIEVVIDCRASLSRSIHEDGCLKFDVEILDCDR